MNSHSSIFSNLYFEKVGLSIPKFLNTKLGFDLFYFNFPTISKH